MAAKLQERLIDQVDRLSKEHIDNVLERRYQRLMSYGNP
jgi:acetyl-CoA carboxylase carboxyl transferase subunit alpha